MFRMRRDLSEASSVMVEEGGWGGRGGERKFLGSLYQEEWTPLLLSLAVAGEQRKQGSERETTRWLIR